MSVAFFFNKIAYENRSELNLLTKQKDMLNMLNVFNFGHDVNITRLFGSNKELNQFLNEWENVGEVDSLMA